MKPRLGAVRFLSLLVVAGACSGTAPTTDSPTRSAVRDPNTSVASDAPAPSVTPSAIATKIPPETIAASPGPSIFSASQSPAPSPLATQRVGLPAFRHIYVIVMENKEYATVVGSPDAPYLNSLVAGYGLATNYNAVAHPSEPNYLALWSGATQGVTDDGVHTISGPSLADQVEAKGRSWNVFAENVPLGCFTGATASGGPDGDGNYARKHEPAISFTDIASNPGRCAKITDFSHFDPAAADFELIVPNMCHDMHDCSVATGDAFRRDFVPRITESADFADSVLFITWDEGTRGTGGGGQVATLVINPLVAAGTQSEVAHTHYSLLRTIEDAWGLGCLGEACTANDLGEFFAP